MINEPVTLYILLVEDDPENLQLLIDTLPTTFKGYNLVWEPCDDFDEAVKLVESRRFDLVVTDIYRDRKDRKKGIDIDDEKARDIITHIRNRRFCPVLVFTDGSAPHTIEEGPFVKRADKSVGNDDILAKLDELLVTDVPKLARILHEELDRATGSYLWEFLEKNWQRLNGEGTIVGEVLERMVRRRAAMQLGRLSPQSPNPAEIEHVAGLEFYIYPSISHNNEFRLGEVLRRKQPAEQELKQPEEFRVVLTPHCHLTVQPSDTAPRADYILTVKAFDARKLLEKERPKNLKELRRLIQSPSNLGRPSGRHWFLPGFLDIPDLYCDFLQMESVPYQSLSNADEYERIAVIDTPFAEAMQSCFTQFYSAVGLPGLRPEQFSHLIDNQNDKK